MIKNKSYYSIQFVIFTYAANDFVEIVSYLALRILLQKTILQCNLYSLSDDNYVQRSSDITLNR